MAQVCKNSPSRADKKAPKLQNLVGYFMLARDAKLAAQIARDRHAGWSPVRFREAHYRWQEAKTGSAPRDAAQQKPALTARRSLRGAPARARPPRR